MTTISVPFFNYLSSKLKALRRIAKLRRLFFSNQEALSNSMIALDRNKKELVYLHPQHRLSSYTIISLHQLSTCSVIRNYHSINAGDLQKNKLQCFVKSIFLKLHFRDGSASIHLPTIYQAEKDTNSDVEKLEVKATKWQAIICSSLPRQSLPMA